MSNRTVPVDTPPVDIFRNAFNNMIRQMWSDNKFSWSMQKKSFELVNQEISQNKGKILAANKYSELDKIRDTLTDVLYAKRLFQRTQYKSIKELEAVAARFAMEVFENDRDVQRARSRIDRGLDGLYKRAGDFRNQQDMRDGLQPLRGHRVSPGEFAASGYRLTDNPAKHPIIMRYVKMLDEYQKNYNPAKK